MSCDGASSTNASSLEKVVCGYIVEDEVPCQSGQCPDRESHEIKTMVREQHYRVVTIPIAKASGPSRVCEGIFLKIKISVYLHCCH